MNIISKKRGGIISLTQTEIMLVLVVVILLLLIMKEGDLAATKSELLNLASKSEKEISQLRKHTTKSGEQLAKMEQQIDLAQEVKSILVRGDNSRPNNKSAELEKEDIAELLALVANREQLKKERAAIDKALERGTSANEPRSLNKQTANQLSREEQIEQLIRNAVIGNTLSQNLDKETRKALNQANSSNQQKPSIDKFMEELASDADAGREARIKAGLGDQVGFNPCWPRPASKGARRYYYAYDVTYTNGLYYITPHRDWNGNIPTIAEALKEKLRILNRYPRKAISRKEFSAFGKQIERALAPIRGTRQDGTYPEECLLAITLNEEATGSIAKFIRHEVNLYPITR